MQQEQVTRLARRRATRRDEALEPLRIPYPPLADDPVDDLLVRIDAALNAA